MNNIFKKSLSVISSVAILVASGIIGVNAIVEPSSDEPLEYFWDFSNEEELNDFYFGYLDQRDAGQNYLPSDTNWKDHWALVEEDGRTLLKRTNLVEGEGASTESRIAALTFKEKVPYFEAEVTFKLDQRDPYWSPAVFLYGSDGINNYHGHNSSVVKMAREGHVEIGGWGTGGDGPANNYPYSSQREGNGEKLTADGLGDAYQTMKIRVAPSTDSSQANYPTGRYDLQVWVKNGDKDFVQLVDAKNMNHYWFRRWGFISLQALNGGVAYDSLRIKVLGADGNPVMGVDQTNAADPGATVTYNYDFTNAAQMDNFSSFYYTDENGGDDWVAGTPTPYTDLYDLDTESGKLVRKDLGKSGRSEENALLYLNKRFRFYEAELQYEFGNGWGWTILGFNGQAPGNDYDFESFAAYITQEGQFNFAAPKFQDPIISNAVSDPPTADYHTADMAAGGHTFTKAGAHTLKVRVEKGAADNTIHITVWHKQDNGEFEKLHETDYVNRLMYNRGGYISINTQNDTMKIDNLSVKPLDENGNYLYNPLDKSELQALINNAETNDDGKYTAESFADYAAAILAGQTALTEATTQQEIEDAIAEIERTYSLLQPVTTTSEATTTTSEATTTTSEATTTTSEATTTTSEATTTTSEATTTTSEATTTTSEATTTTSEATTTTTQPTQPSEPDDRFDYVYNFDSQDELSDFAAYWQAVRDGADGFNPGVAEDITVHWELKDGKLVRTGLDKTPGVIPGTDSNNAMLYLTKEMIPYFEAELTFNHGDSWGWPQFNFGSSALGEPVLRSGAGIHMTQEGKLVLSRMEYNEDAGKYISSEEDISSQPFMEGFDKAQQHTYKVRVIKGSENDETLISLWVRQGNGEYVEIVKDYSVIDPEMAANGGYIFLQAQNDNISYDSLKIQKLNADGTDWVEDTTTTTDSEGTETTDTTTSGTDETTTTTSGETNPPATGVTVALTSVVLLAGSAAALVVTKKRRS